MTFDASDNEVAGLTWDKIKQRLAGSAAAILPIGAGAKQHGLHMPMATDQVFAAYFARALAERIDALIWPTLTYGAYPAFVAYAGSVSLSNQTFQAVVTEIADALVGFGAKRVLILDTGLSTIAPVAAAIGASRPTMRRAAASAIPHSPRRRRESGCAPPSPTTCLTRRPNGAATRERLDYVTDCGLRTDRGPVQIGWAVPK